MSIVNIHTYRLAKKYSEDAQDVFKVIDLSMRGLSPFQKYQPVMDIMLQLEMSKSILEAHYQKAQKILDKGTK